MSKKNTDKKEKEAWADYTNNICSYNHCSSSDLVRYTKGNEKYGYADGCAR